MSQSFNKLFLNAIKMIFVKNKQYEFETNSQSIKSCGLLFTLGTFTHGVYAIGTSKTEKSTIVKKYKMSRNGFTEFMVIDEQGKHYNVNNSFWYGKWDSVEDWSNIKEGYELNFKCYGWRVPLLGLFPNIYFTRHNLN